MILAVVNAIYAIAYIEAWKTQDFNGVWSRDLTIPVRRSNQVSYEATDVGGWSFLGSNEPVRNECEWMSNDKSGLNRVSTCDLPIPVRRSNQLSYKATDVGSW